MMDVISYGGRPAAFAGPRRVTFAPWIAAREAGHPELRMVVYMCFYSRELREGRLAGSYGDEAARLFARYALMDDDEFLAAAGEGDEALAQRFGAPVGEVVAKRQDLGLDGWSG